MALTVSVLVFLVKVHIENPLLLDLLAERAVWWGHCLEVWNSYHKDIFFLTLHLSNNFQKGKCGKHHSSHFRCLQSPRVCALTSSHFCWKAVWGWTKPESTSGTGRPHLAHWSSVPLLWLSPRLEVRSDRMVSCAWAVHQSHFSLSCFLLLVFLVPLNFNFSDSPTESLKVGNDEEWKKSYFLCLTEQDSSSCLLLTNITRCLAYTKWTFFSLFFLPLKGHLVAFSTSVGNHGFSGHFCYLGGQMAF